MKGCVFAAILMALPPVLAFGAELEIKKGDSAKIDTIDIAEVKNLDEIKNKTRTFVYGDRCHLSGDGALTVIAADGNRVLVRYSTAKETDGSLCPDGTIFFYSKEKFIKTAEEERRRNRELKEEKELIKKLLGK